MSRTATLFLGLAFLLMANLGHSQCNPYNAFIQAHGQSCGTQPVFISIAINGGLPPYSVVYSLNGNETTITMGTTDTDILVPISGPTNYNLVSVMDADGCPANLFGNGLIEILPTPTPEIDGFFSICQGDFTCVMATFGYQSYQWSTGETTQEVCIGLPGTYSLTVVDENGCFGEVAIEISELPAPEPEIQGPEQLGPDEMGVLSVSSGFINYFWSNGDTGSSTTVFGPGTHSVTVVDANGCMGDDTFVIAPEPPANISCDSAEVLFLSVGSCDVPIVDGFLLSNVGQVDSSAMPLLFGCEGDLQTNAATASVWYTFVSNSDSLSIILDGLNNPNIVLYRGDNCQELIPIACGSDQSVVNINTNVQIGEQYYLQIAGENAQDQGEFTLVFNNYMKCNDECRVNSFLTVDPMPVNGQFAQGEEVTFCFHVPGMSLIDDSWLHAVEVDFGSAWNLSTFNPDFIVPCGNTQGMWNWYFAWISCLTGELFGPGFAFDSPSSSCGGIPFDGDPGNNWGNGESGCDGVAGLPFQFCWTISVQDCIPDGDPLDLNINIDVLNDGLSGGWTSEGCQVPFDYFFSVGPALPAAFVDLGPDATNNCFGDSYLIDASVPNCSDCTYLWNTGQTTSSIQVQEDGLYSVSVTHQDGCFSEDEIQVTFNEPNLTEIDTTICEGESFFIGGQVFNQTGSYGIVLSSSNGCDSIISLEITVLSGFITFITEEICDGDSYQLGNSIYTLTGQYTEVFTTSSGCDSVVELDLTVWPSPFTSTSAEICEGESYPFGNNIYTESGLYTEMFTTVHGCDSTVELSLLVSPNASDTMAITICEGETFPFMGDIYTTSGIYPVSIPGGTANGCDSTVILDLEVLPDIINNIDTTIIEGESLIVNGNTFDMTGTYTEILFGGAANGCDSIIYLNLMVVPPNCDPNVINLETNIEVVQEISCNGATDGIVELSILVDDIQVVDLTDYEILWSNGVANETIVSGLSAGVYSVTITNPIGCEVFNNITLTEPSIPEEDITASICEGEVLTINFIDYTEAGSYQDILVDNNGCDSILNITIEVLPLPIPVITASETFICEGESVSLTASGGISYEWFNGETAETIIVEPSNTSFYTVTVTDENGCMGEVDISIAVIDELDPLSIFCTASTEVIIFEWNELNGITEYEVSINGNQSQIINSTNFTVTGLIPDEEVTIEVIPVYDGPCPNTGASLTCISGSCPDIVFDLPDLDSICDTDPPFELIVNANGGSGLGGYTWQGVGVLTGSNIFDPMVAGIGNHIVDFFYTDGNCTYESTLIITVYPTPEAAFNLENKTCINEIATATFQGQAGADATYIWDFDGGIAMPGTGAGPHEISWDTSGLKTVSLIIEENGCVSEVFSRDIEVETNLPRPNISCLALNNVMAFGWQPIAGATGYDVNVLTGQTGVLNGALFTVSGLSPDEEVTIEVVAINGGGICEDSRDTLSCTPGNDPIIMLSQPEFELDQDGTVRLKPDLENSSIKLQGPFPNPAKHQAVLNLALGQPQTLSISLVDISGKIHQTIASNIFDRGSHQFKVATNHLAAGLYFLKINIEGKLFTKKLVVIN